MNHIKKARTAAGLSQKFVAMTLGVSGPSVSNWESGKTKPTPENYIALSQLFAVSVDYLMGIDEEIPATTDSPAIMAPESQMPKENIIQERLRELRLLTGENQETVAEACGISRIALARYEGGQRMPQANILLKLADYYGVTTDFLIGRVDEVSQSKKPTLKDELVEKVIQELQSLQPHEVNRVSDFVSGLKAARTDEADQQK